MLLNSFGWEEKIVGRYITFNNGQKEEVAHFFVTTKNGGNSFL